MWSYFVVLGGICPSPLMSCMYCTFNVLYGFFLVLLVWHTIWQYNLPCTNQPLYPELIVNSFDIKRSAATFGQFACTLNGKHQVIYTCKHSQELRQWETVSAYIISPHLTLPSCRYVRYKCFVNHVTINSQAVCTLWLKYYVGTLCSHEARPLIYVNMSYDLLFEQYYLTCATARIDDIRKLRYQINGVGGYHLHGSNASHVPWIYFFSLSAKLLRLFSQLHMPYIVVSFFFEAHNPIHGNKLNYTLVGF